MNSRTVVALVFSAALGAGCGGGVPVPEDGGGTTDAGSCALVEGTYTVESVDLTQGACDLLPSDQTIVVRRLLSGWAIDFDSTDWAPADVSDECDVWTSGPDYWFFNGTVRTRALHFSVQGDVLSGEISDSLDDPDSMGRTCDGTFSFLARRSGPAPEGAALGDNACGPVGCSGSLCTFGNRIGCASGACLLDDRADEFGFAVYCTQPCDASAPCPADYVCIASQESYDGAPEGTYCARDIALCGDRTTQSGEACDDGNRLDGDGCSSSCLREGCGNAMLERGETCEAAATGEWLECSADCTIVAPTNTSMPLDPDTFATALVALGPNTYVLGGTAFREGVGYVTTVARTDDAASTWSRTDLATENLLSLAARGDRVVAALGQGPSSEFFLFESIDGGRTFIGPFAQALPEGMVDYEFGLEIAIAADGGLLALARGTGNMLVLRREPGASQWVVTGRLPLESAGGISACQLFVVPPRLDQLYGPGAVLDVTDARVLVAVGARCGTTDAVTSSIVVRAAVSIDDGRTFEPGQNLETIAGLATVHAAPFAVALDGSAVACMDGEPTTGGRSIRCGAATAANDWSFAFATANLPPTGAWSNPPDAIAAPDGTTILMARQSVSGDGVETTLHRSTDGGVNWVSEGAPSLDNRTRGIFLLDASHAWLVDPDDASNVSLVRFAADLSSVQTPISLAGRPTLRNGSGPPWLLRWARDGAGHALMSFQMPDTLRGRLVFTRAMD